MLRFRRKPSVYFTWRSESGETEIPDSVQKRLVFQSPPPWGSQPWQEELVLTPPPLLLIWRKIRRPASSQQIFPLSTKTTFYCVHVSTDSEPRPHLDGRRSGRWMTQEHKRIQQMCVLCYSVTVKDVTRCHYCNQQRILSVGTFVRPGVSARKVNSFWPLLLSFVCFERWFSVINVSVLLNSQNKTMFAMKKFGLCSGPDTLAAVYRRMVHTGRLDVQRLQMFLQLRPQICWHLKPQRVVYESRWTEDEETAAATGRGEEE